MQVTLGMSDDKRQGMENFDDLAYVHNVSSPPIKGIFRDKWEQGLTPQQLNRL